MSVLTELPCTIHKDIIEHVHIKMPLNDPTCFQHVGHRSTTFLKVTVQFSVLPVESEGGRQTNQSKHDLIRLDQIRLV